jgi:hypothetical protein
MRGDDGRRRPVHRRHSVVSPLSRPRVSSVERRRPAVPLIDASICRCNPSIPSAETRPISALLRSSNSAAFHSQTKRAIRRLEIRSQPLNAGPRLLFDQRIRAGLSGPLAASGELQRLHRCEGEIYDAEGPARVPGFVAAQERAQLCRSRMLCPGRRRPVYLGRNA